MATPLEFRNVTGSSSVDLSRLPAPTIVEQLSFETIFAGMVADLQARLPTFDATIESDPAVKVLQVAAYRELLIRQDFNDRARQLLVAYATGANLDHLAAIFRVERRVLVEANPLLGVDQVLESDDEFRRRVTLAPESYTVAGPELAYVFHALSAHPDVIDATATSPVPGDVVVTVLSRNGDGSATPEMLQAVAARANGETVRPLTDNVTVQGPEVRPFAIAAEVFTFHGPDATIIVDAARASLDRYLAANRRLGRDITLSGLYGALHVAGVQRVVLAEPLETLTITPLQVANCTAIAVEFGGYDN